MLEHYLTIKEEGSHEIEIQKSRFIGHVKRTETEEEAQEFIQQIKKEHKSATHNCSAYMIGEQNLTQKAHDDGEPSGTAGVPMLEVLKQMDLKDTTIIVTRYFGGIKLGAGGLIRAYSSSTSEAIKAVGIVRRSLMQHIQLKVDYHLIGKVENELRNSSFLLKKIEYLDQVTFNIYAPISEAESCNDWLVNLTSGQGHIDFKDQAYIEEDVQLN
ncbi:YigZ family protein [Aquisalibacillus elongatus]|uniref:Putative YigZ family protein n=1 Tax=Aquisalibacillus elongatus TaxID=485577 RepID=A0A3N5BAD2_9BACI|nr:YigZ family protein [Aquisalibacillus elongatus]RPF54347.1 putative YigZ family protein [Aquisalibacillus elongatus]